MSDLVGSSDDRFSHEPAHIYKILKKGDLLATYRSKAVVLV